ncbi:hypothetical protein PESP_a0686 [Pseudoalteromonas espejiana DSM 9414]|nr:hypothetical protein PESP_a0686 [Pseudoalteromonas espejiana DSM 9414]
MSFSASPTEGILIIFFCTYLLVISLILGEVSKFSASIKKAMQCMAF